MLNAEIEVRSSSENKTTTKHKLLRGERHTKMKERKKERKLFFVLVLLKFFLLVNEHKHNFIDDDF